MVRNQGEMWDYNKDGVPEIKDDVRKLLYTDRKKYNSIYGGDSCYWMMQNDAMASQWIKDDPDNPVTQLKKMVISLYHIRWAIYHCF